MKKKLLTLLFSLNLLFGVCKPNPTQLLTDIFSLDYSAMLPLKIAGATILPGPIPDSIDTPHTPICICPAPPPIMLRIGIPVGFYNPDRMVDSVKDPYCFEGLGISITPINIKGAGVQADDPQSGVHSFFQTHLVSFPVFQVLDLMIDFICLQSPTGVDILYLTEIDPMWNSDSLSALIQPEALLFGNPITNLACMADSIASQIYMPIDALFWCKGSWGNAYPMTGSVTSGDLIQSSASAAASLLYKLHRQLILWGQWGYEGLCFRYPLPIWQKSAYRLQLIAPIPFIKAITIGQTGMLWDSAKNPPFAGDNFSYIIFRKRDCCAF